GAASAAGLAAHRTGLAADLRPVAQPDRETLALAAPRRLEVASARGRLAGVAAAGAYLPRSVRARLAPLAGGWPASAQRLSRAAGPWPLITEFRGQNSLGSLVMLAGEALQQFAIRGWVCASYGRQIPQVLYDYTGACLTHGCASHGHGKVPYLIILPEGSLADIFLKNF